MTTYFRPATEIHRAIDLSCRACGAMAMGAGLGFPVEDSAPLRFQPQPPIQGLEVARTPGSSSGSGSEGPEEEYEDTGDFKP